MATKKKVPAKKAVEKPLLTVLVTQGSFVERFGSIEQAVNLLLEEGDSPEEIEAYGFFKVIGGEIVPVKNLKVVVPVQKVEITYNV